jgi:Transglutaminase-like superfamily
MHRLRKFLELSAAERRLLLSAFLLAAAVRLGLWLLPFRALQRLLSQTIRGPVHARNDHQTSSESIAWAVCAASRYVPQATCLTQAITTQVLLTLHGHVAHLRIGVAKNKNGTLEAHAWVESQGRVVFGGADLSRYTPLLAAGADKFEDTL